MFSTHTYDRRFFDEANAAHGHDLRSVAEHAVALILSLNRRMHRAYARVREGNFALDGLLGFHLRGRTAGIVGTGAIGSVVARILAGFGCRVIASDVAPSAACASAGVEYVPLDDLWAREEENLFFEDRSADVIQDDVFARLLTFPNVLVTAHQAFFTREALTAIAETTLGNVTAFAEGRSSGNDL